MRTNPGQALSRRLPVLFKGQADMTRLQRTFNILTVLCLVIVFASLPAIAAHAAPAIQETQPAFDWGLTIEQILSVAIPILATALTAWAAASARYWWGRLAIERPDVMDLITQAALYATPIIEQLKKSGVILDNQTAKLKAMQLAREWLSIKGVNAQQQEMYLKFIDLAIEGAVHALSSGTTTVTLTPVSSES
jgi:hypothetical protein